MLNKRMLSFQHSSHSGRICVCERTNDMEIYNYILEFEYKLHSNFDAYAYVQCAHTHTHTFILILDELRK